MKKPKLIPVPKELYTYGDGSKSLNECRNVVWYLSRVNIDKTAVIIKTGSDGGPKLVEGQPTAYEVCTLEYANKWNFEIVK